ncbi:hypothetical protein BJX64DRAFT_281304 [Aspergillus heterothallicus]
MYDWIELIVIIWTCLLFAGTNKAYTHEANAYPALSKFQGKEIPKYYGSYTLNFPTHSHRQGVVRMILIEHIEGDTMVDFQPEDIPQSMRKEIMKSIVDIESQIYEKDLLLSDLEPRNVVLTPSTAETNHPRTVLIDFGDVLFNRTRDGPLALKIENFLGQYISPLLRWKEHWQKLCPFEEWFAHTAASITEEMRERWSDD